MEKNCLRCGYPEIGPRVPSLLGVAPVCVPCAQVEAMEMQQLGRVLPLDDWAFRDNARRR